MNNLLRGYSFFLLVVFSVALPPLSLCETNPADGLIKSDFASLQYSFPVAKNWSFEKLSSALLYAEEIGSTAVIVLHDGKLVLEWGKTTLRIKSQYIFQAPGQGGISHRNDNLKLTTCDD